MDHGGADASAPVERRLAARDGVDVLVPDGTPLGSALARTTDLGIAAHPDDLELSMLVPIGECRGHHDRWFTGITVTDGAGSPRAGRFAVLDDAAMARVRMAEQREAGALGGYGALVQLGYASAAVRPAVSAAGVGAPDGRMSLVEDLAVLLRAAAPTAVYTHNLADGHPTHVAVTAATVHAIRSLPPAERPGRLIGMEGWRDLDWLPGDLRIALDAGPHLGLGRRLVQCFASQLEAKRYDLAVEGRLRANATLAGPWSPDRTEAVAVGMDLTPLVHDDDLDPATFVAASIERFRHEAERAVSTAFAGRDPGVS